ncbi:MAG: DsbA family protein [Candidatus Yanofskybacteria bacterium]|nr:DsbA family protein [Candidatus Yanofskybacteria bacterium]
MDEGSKFDLTKLILPGAIILAGVMIGAAIIYSNGGPPAGGVGAANIENNSGGQKVEVSVDDDAFLGDKDAPVVMIEFSDFQCPFCRSFWRDTLLLIKSEYIDTGKVKFVYRDFPLSFHLGAMSAAQASECAEEQGKFWEMHDKIFIEQEKLGGGTVQFDANDLKRWAGELGLNAGEFNSCLDSEKYAEEVNNDSQDGQASGVSGTPGFFINGRLVVGAQPFSVFKVIIDEELAK